MIYSRVENSIFENLKRQIEKGDELSPFLFLDPKGEILHANLEAFITELFRDNTIDLQSLFHLRDTGESIKIEEVKKFLAQGDIKPRFAFQIFFIENISRMTLQSANACLKFFEEPGKGNIIFLTNSSEGGVLETILSRAQIITNSSSNDGGDTRGFFKSMISSHMSGTSDELVRYFFSGKYEKEEYIEFLRAVVACIPGSRLGNDILDELHEDIGGILRNNLQGRYIVDKYIMLLKG